MSVVMALTILIVAVMLVIEGCIYLFHRAGHRLMGR